MSNYGAQIIWHRRRDESFIDGRYSRVHEFHFDGGVTVPASSAVHSVPEPYSDPHCVDPEEAFIAAIASCHLLTFLYLAAQAGFVINSYMDQASGSLSRSDRGRLAMTRVVLAPDIVFSGSQIPSETQVASLHHAAHEECYIANSVRAEILIQGRWRHER